MSSDKWEEPALTLPPGLGSQQRVGVSPAGPSAPPTAPGQPCPSGTRPSPDEAPRQPYQACIRAPFPPHTLSALWPLLPYLLGVRAEQGHWLVHSRHPPVRAGRQARGPVREQGAAAPEQPDPLLAILHIGTAGLRSL